MQSVEISEFLNAPGVILDVRSPGEFAAGSIPGAINLPLFSDEERALLGTMYRHHGREEAIEKGFALVGPNLVELISKAKYFCKGGKAKVHCWRGGMRSESVAALLHHIGIPTIYLKDGYKAYRRWVNDVLLKQQQLAVIGGLTGSGKTDILYALQSRGEQVLDLEALAGHKGSAFGNIGMPKQPTTEQFHNEMAMLWERFDSEQIVWVEDESQSIGKCFIPESVHVQIRRSPLFFVNRPISERLEILVRDYGEKNTEELVDATLRIQKKLGGLRTRQVIEAIRKGELKAAAEVILDYYDRTYRYMLRKREGSVTTLEGKNLSSDQWAEKLRISTVASGATQKVLV